MRGEERIKVILDTNLWVSILIGKRLYSIQDLMSSGGVEIVTCSELLDEIGCVTSRSKLSKYFTVEYLSMFWRFIVKNTVAFNIGNIPLRCRDPKDDYLLELAVVSGANYLVTGDKDLLSVKKISDCNIVSVAEFDVIAKSLGYPATLHEELGEYLSIVIGE